MSLNHKFFTPKKHSTKMCEATANGSAAFMYVHMGMSVCVYSIFFACGNSNIWHVIVVVSLALSAAIENVKGLDSSIYVYFTLHR